MTEILDYAASAETGASSKELLVQEAIEYSPSDDLAASMIDLRIRDIESSDLVHAGIAGRPQGRLFVSEAMSSPAGSIVYGNNS
jgi:hypothetical protein